MDVFYKMQKAGWDAKRGEYSIVEKISPKLSLKQVQGRVGRLQNSSTLFLWTIYKYRKTDDVYSNRESIGYTNAEEFENDVPTFDEETI